jgi:hypothetical protein
MPSSEWCDMLAALSFRRRMNEYNGNRKTLLFDHQNRYFLSLLDLFNVHFYRYAALEKNMKFFLQLHSSQRNFCAILRIFFLSLASLHFKHVTTIFNLLSIRCEISLRAESSSLLSISFLC